MERPQWWTDRIQAAWDRSREAAEADWRARGHPTTPMDRSIVELALAFGHGARSAYPHMTTWAAARPQLRADWVRLGHVGSAAWDRVVAIIRHEWARAAGPSGDAVPEPDPDHDLTRVR
ncbi:MAG TPA: hypothetical protein VL463_09255 [Kofleriaceae bacterium]|nr:hypothetical protein [Kofleriaceae bacterium]